MSICIPVRKKNSLLPLPSHDQRLLPALRLPAGPLTSQRRRRPDVQIVHEFRAKLRMAEDLISKLAYNLREIQGMWRKPKSDGSGRKKADVRPHAKRR